MIAVVDYGVGNIRSILNMLERIGATAAITSSPEELAGADKIVLPGVGAFDEAMESLERLGFLPVLRERVLERGCPVLGICLGMQLLSHGSEEGRRPGLGWIAAHTRRFEPAPGIKIPHMGWNTVQTAKPSPLFEDMPEPEPRFYFIHSYHVVCDDARDRLAEACHGRPFTAAVARGHILGTQFHPEKSHKFGLRLLANFAEKC